MSAQPSTTDRDPGTIEGAIDTMIAWLADSDARRMIIDRWRAGWCTSDFALKTLVDLHLVEFTPDPQEPA